MDSYRPTKFPPQYMNPHDLQTTSIMNDHDWKRIECCRDPWERPQKERLFDPGSLNGIWDGFVVVSLLHSLRFDISLFNPLEPD